MARIRNLGVLFIVAAFAATCRADNVEDSTVTAASEVLHEIMGIPAKAIPASLLAEAHGVAIVPSMIKGGFVIGVRHGRGVIVTRDANDTWTAPWFITVSGGSVGWQAGLQATDLVVVFRNRRGVDGLMRGKFTIGADAAVAAGPVGREASAATDAQLTAEILSYSRSRGLFAGVAIDGAVLHVDRAATAAYYAPRPGQPEGTIPAAAVKLVEQIAAYAEPRHKGPVSVKNVPAAPALPPLPEDIDAIRARLADSGRRLHSIVDAPWKEYLALPAEVYIDGRTPVVEDVGRALSRFATVAGDARYQGLSARPEFQETYAALSRYRSALQANRTGTLKLPPPPPK